ncbi:MAG: DUF2244 domain-containing protein [Hyphomicrobium denitrificans]|nr:DUF2244 domain-containing protein [Hyphomicrobium denitrificans]
MTDSLAEKQSANVTRFVLHPYRSLTPRGFTILMTVLGLVSFAVGSVFLLMGAWPVFGFFGLDVLLLYLAFRINYRAAAAYEEVTVTATELKVRKVTHHGRVREWTLNPLWVRLETVTHADYGMEKLLLVTRGRALPIATLLGPDEKASFAKALGAALGEAKRGPTRTVLP